MLPRFSTDDDEQPAVTIIHSGVVLDWMERDLRRLTDDPLLRFSEEPVFIKDGAYRPPGVWVNYTGNRYEIGTRILFWFPSPYHPLEVLAAYRGFGGAKASHGALDGEDWAKVAKAQSARFGGWLSYTAKLAETLLITVSQARLLYHLFTPLATNGCDPEDDVAVVELRERLWQACGMRPSGMRPSRHPHRAVRPVRMDFYGKEVYGRVEL